VALMVPEHSLAAYQRGAPLGGDCTRRLNRQETLAQRLDMVRPRRTPLLDYRFVRIVWKDERDAERERLTVEFRDWLAGQGRRLGEGFEPPGLPSTAEPVTKAGLETARSQIAATRRPRTLLFALDRSGSMKAPVSGGTAIGRARDVVREATNWLGGNDSTGLWAFPEGLDGREPRVLTDLARRDDAVPDLRDRLDGPGTDAEGRTTPLHHVIVRGVETLREASGEGSLVVLTDGDNDAGGHADEDLAALREELRAPGGPRVYLVVVGERGCDEPLSDPLPDSPRWRCLAFGPSTDPQQMVGRLFTYIWKD
jgi:hypothetical protein